MIKVLVFKIGQLNAPDLNTPDSLLRVMRRKTGEPLFLQGALKHIAAIGWAVS